MRRQRLASPGTAGLRQGGHGLTAAQVEDILARQGGVCLICGRGRGSGPWCIDHDHELAALHSHPSDRGCRYCVRGILCQPCNVGLGNFRDSPDLLRRAADYVDLARALR